MHKSILIVEDEFLIALHLQQILEGHGWTVIGPAAKVKDALALLEIALSTVALLDVNLGGEAVTPVALELKQRNVPFVVASAYAEPEHYAGQVLAGVPNAGKPINERRLLATLRQVTGC